MNMTPELYYAALSCGMTLLIWVPNLFERIKILGLKSYCIIKMGLDLQIRVRCRIGQRELEELITIQ